MKKFLIILLPFLIQQYICAQDKEWTLGECIGYAIEHNQKKVRQEAQNKIYSADKLEAIGGFLPSLNAQTNITGSFGRNIDDATNTYINVNTFSNPYGIYSSLTLFDGLANVYRLKRSNLYKAMGVEQLQDTKDQIALETMELYFNVLYYRGVVGLAQQQLDDSREELRKTERMQELGLKSIPDLAEIQAKEAEDHFALTKQKNALAMELIKLKEKMNFPINEELAITQHEQLLSIHSINDDIMQIYQEALSNLPKALASEKQIAAIEMNHKIAKGSVLPSLSVDAGVETVFARSMNYSEYLAFNEQFKNNRGEYVRLTLTVPLFNGFGKASNIKRNKQLLIIARSQHEETLYNIYSEIEQTVADVNGLVNEYNSAQKRTASMESAHKANQRKYEEGLISALELSTSSNRLLNARVEELYTGLRYQLKYRLLNYYKQGTDFY